VQGWLGGWGAAGGGYGREGVTSRASPNPNPSSSPAPNPSPSPSPNRNPNLDESRCAGKGASYRTPLDQLVLRHGRGTWL
jgi:hypothetical protein